MPASASDALDLVFVRARRARRERVTPNGKSDTTTRSCASPRRWRVRSLSSRGNARSVDVERRAVLCSQTSQTHPRRRGGHGVEVLRSRLDVAHGVHVPAHARWTCRRRSKRRRAKLGRRGTPPRTYARAPRPRHVARPAPPTSRRTSVVFAATRVATTGKYERAVRTSAFFAEIVVVTSPCHLRRSDCARTR